MLARELLCVPAPIFRTPASARACDRLRRSGTPAGIGPEPVRAGRRTTLILDA